MGIGFNYDEFKAFTKKWNKVYDDFEEFLKKFLLEQAFRAIEKIKPRTPVGTPESTGIPGYVGGALHSMWGIGSQNLVIVRAGERMEVDPEQSTVATIDMIGNNFEVVIWNGMDYASFVEYGTIKMKGHFMMTISVDEVNNQMPARFNQAWNQYLSSKGVG